MNVYLVAVSNKWIDDSAIVTFPVATDNPYFFGDGDVDLVNCFARMTEFTKVCKDYLREHAGAFHPAWPYFNAYMSNDTKIVSVSKLDTAVSNNTGVKSLRLGT